MLFRFLHGMYAFGLVETNFYNEAEKHAQQVNTVAQRKFFELYERFPEPAAKRKPIKVRFRANHPTISLKTTQEMMIL